MHLITPCELIACMSQVTQKDIAKALGVSRETVTKAMMNHPKVAQKTKELVANKAKELGYFPNFFARNLSSGQSRIIGLIIPKIAHSFFSTITEEIYMRCRERGYTMITMISFEDVRNEENNINTLISMQVDGVIACISKNTFDDASFRFFKKKNIPIVFFDRVFDQAPFNRVVADDREIAFEAVSYALKKGYRRPAHLAGYSRINIGKERKKGFADALHKFRIKPDETMIIEGGFTFQDGYQNALRLLKRKDPPDLIFTINDTVAHGVYQAAKELGIVIPDQLGVLGFGNLEIGSLINPPLTSINIPVAKLAENVVELILERIMGKQELKNIRTVVPAQLVIRESC